jgi:hypothetical protein
VTNIYLPSITYHFAVTMENIQIKMKSGFNHWLVKVTCQTLSINRVLVKYFWTLLQAHAHVCAPTHTHTRTHTSVCGVFLRVRACVRARVRVHTFPSLFYVVLLLTLSLCSKHFCGKMQMTFSVSR